MRYLPSMKSSALVALSLILPLLAACATDGTPPPNLTPPVRTSTAAAQAPEPLACTELPALKFNAGKDGATQADVTAAMADHPDNPLGWARGVLGDTKSTRDAIATNRAKRVALGCTNP